jgi:hypothetical protein
MPGIFESEVTHMFRMRASLGRSAAILLLGLLALVAPGSMTQAGEEADGGDLAAIAQNPAVLDDFVDADLRYRRALHFRADRDYVEGLWQNLDATVGHRSVGVLLTPDEWQEFVARERLNQDVDLLRGVFEQGSSARDNFGGMMIDHAAGGVLAVYLLDTTRDNWAGDLPHPGRLVIRHAERSYDDLLRMKAQVAGAWAAGDQGTGSITGVGLDVSSNAVRVYFEPGAISDLATGDVPASFAGRFGRDGYVATPSVGARAATSPLNVKGGWTYDDDPAGFVCTLGLSVRDPDFTDRRYSLSAGHCMDQYAYDANPTIYHNYGSLAGEDVGKMVEHSFINDTNADVVYFRIYDAAQDGDDFTSIARVVHGNGGTPYGLRVSDAVSGHTQGTSRCHSGRGEGDTTITHCGPITDETYNAFYSGKHINDTVVFDAHGSDGDSGGPVYWLNPDNNIVKGAGVFNGVTSGDSFYTTINHALNARDWDIYLATDSGDGCDLPGQNRGLPSCPVDQGGDYAGW